MIKVIIKDRDPNDILEIVCELRDQGLVQGQDFDFKYCPYSHDSFTGEDVDRHTVFSFHTEKYATLFALRYS